MKRCQEHKLEGNAECLACLNEALMDFNMAIALRNAREELVFAAWKFAKDPSSKGIEQLELAAERYGEQLDRSRNAFEDA